MTKKINRIQKGTMFGKKVTIDLSKSLIDQPWFKSDLFCERQKDVIQHIYENTGGRDFDIKEISGDYEK